ncbi:hypothetical protein HDU86_000074 [Geranomyces michiganensis]|nr:hypothetical protein HDU86_000074 [Geranomyces michiganensis]
MLSQNVKVTGFARLLRDLQEIHREPVAGVEVHVCEDDVTRLYNPANPANPADPANPANPPTVPAPPAFPLAPAARGAAVPDTHAGDAYGFILSIPGRTSVVPGVHLNNKRLKLIGTNIPTHPDDNEVKTAECGLHLASGDKRKNFSLGYLHPDSDAAFPTVGRNLLYPLLKQEVVRSIRSDTRARRAVVSYMHGGQQRKAGPGGVHEKSGGATQSCLQLQMKIDAGDIVP